MTAELFGNDPRQPAVECQECGTALGYGTPKDVYSHLITCLHVEPNSLENIADNAHDARNEHGRRVLHIVEALQGSIAKGIIAAAEGPAAAASAGTVREGG